MLTRGTHQSNSEKGAQKWQVSWNLWKSSIDVRKLLCERISEEYI